MCGTRYVSNTPRGIQKRRVQGYESWSDRRIPQSSERDATKEYEIGTGKTEVHGLFRLVFHISPNVSDATSSNTQRVERHQSRLRSCPIRWSGEGDITYVRSGVCGIVDAVTSELAVAWECPGVRPFRRWCV